MKTTYPYNWKAISIENHTDVEGRFLMNQGCGDYAISTSDDVLDAARGYFGTPIKSNTLYWQCHVCKDWNYRKEIICKCGAILDKFKEDIIDG